MAAETNATSLIALPKLWVGVTAPKSPLIYTSGDAAIEIPFPTVEAASNQIIFPAYAVVATGISGTSGSLLEQVPSILAEASGEPSPDGGADIQLAALVLVADGVSGTAGGLAKSLSQWTAEAYGETGTVGSIALQLPGFALEGSGSAPVAGVAAIALPLFAMSGTGAGPALDDFSAYAMNASTAGLTSYTNFPFNSMTMFNGVALAAGDNGIYALTGSTDDAVAIVSKVRLGIFDFGSDKLKRIDSAYFAYRSNGDLAVRVTLDDGDQHEYTLEGTGNDGIFTNRLKMGKGLKARYWQYEIEGTGVDWGLDGLDLKPVELSRRI